MKLNVYIDGFNLYYGSLKGTSYKWLDLLEMSKLLFPRDTINEIKYFTARVKPRPHDPGQPTRQNFYLRAIETISNLKVIKGRYLVSYKRMPIAGTDPREFAPGYQN